MKWYIEEANQQDAIENEDAQKQSVIQRSGWWNKLRLQIEEDCRGISEADGFWISRLAGYPLEVLNHEDGTPAYKILKRAWPALVITVRPVGMYGLEFERASHEHPEYVTKRTRTLAVESDGEGVYLVTDTNDQHQIPEGAARYILTPIIEMLKTVKPQT